MGRNTENGRNGYVEFDPRYFVPSAVEAGAPSLDFLDSEKKDLRERMQKLESWIEDRKRIMDENLLRIEEDTCLVDRQVEETACREPLDPKHIHDLEGSLLELENQKRLEKTGAWKDMFLVSKELLELFKEYQRLGRMESIS